LSDDTETVQCSPLRGETGVSNRAKATTPSAPMTSERPRTMTSQPRARYVMTMLLLLLMLLTM